MANLSWGVQIRRSSKDPSDPCLAGVQSAIFADAPAEARRLIRRKQRGADEIVLDGVQFGCMVSRVANRHADGGTWTLSRAIRDALPDLEKLEAKKAAAGKDFGELVRERRRQRGLPLPIAEKVLPFRATTRDEHTQPDDETAFDAMSCDDPLQTCAAGAEAQVAEAWAQLEAAEHAGKSQRMLDDLEEAYVRAMRAVLTGGAPAAEFAG